ncbi:hypothetical protein NitYY0826_C0033 [Nitratiruptor sp. YY08-26]|uniref:DUF6858 family protein n=1 Tax=unclassified Nitratiruptor TaxID=2624044 RepID=UPI0019169D52|nr:MULTISPECIES: hypothetical protein [unclassified Nitratiruptor]BCD61200.1 hypothetical protein NitYY0813_C0033 [Nitratiruptor sp. YY08-13]BCD65133.1 hypothetical protein NitYY0826_C0033 [Nitratiruptor sp. YY08-26]
MKQITLMEKYPLFILELNKNETNYKNVDEIIAYFKEKIEAHPVATYIATFDHYAHTKSLADGQINPEIQAAKNIVFCFGKELPKPEVMGVRPRSIGVADLGEKFVISFLEAPNPTANAAMEEWAKGLRA